MQDCYRFAFLILNYETYWETIKCVNSIFKVINGQLKDEENCFIFDGKIRFDIIIVDNGSKNDSLQKLNLKYGDMEYVHILESGENLGFARGNNIGFSYAKRKLDPDFIVMINSDIVMVEKDFYNKVISHYEEKNFAVAGPDVRLKNGQAQSPGRSKIVDTESISKSVRKLKFQILLCKMHIEPFYAAFKRFQRSVKKTVPVIPQNGKLNLQAGEQLHGSFLIFSREYLSLFDGINDKTFLYGEEILLRFRCLRAGLSMYFLDDIKALHNESQTEKFIGGRMNERHLNRHLNGLASVYAIKEYLTDESSI